MDVILFVCFFCTLNVILENVLSKKFHDSYILKIWIDQKWVHISLKFDI